MPLFLFIPAVIIANVDFLSQDIVVLAVFIPLVLGISGNTRTWSLVAVHRGLSEKRLTNNSFLKLLKRQTITASLMAIVCGSFAGLIGFILIGSHNLMGVIILSMFFSLFICTLTGTLIPFLVSKLKTDLAVGSSPFINSVNDIIAIVIYFFRCKDGILLLLKINQ